MQENDIRDVIIIGGSYSGLAAAMALGRALQKVLVIDGGQPCNRQTPYSHNFLTQDGTVPKEIADLGKSQVMRYPTVQFYPGIVVDAKTTSYGYEIITEDGNMFSARKLLFATGIRDILPAIPGLAEAWGISVLHCPFCHGYEVRHQTTGLLGNGVSGFEMAALLSNWTKDLTVFTNGRSDFTEEQTQKLALHSIGIEEREIDHIKQMDGQIREIIYKDGKSAVISSLYVRPPFVQHCQLPGKLGCELTEDGYIKVDAAQQTTVSGVYACGDNVSRMRTVANAVSTGTTAGISLSKVLVTSMF